MTLDFTIEPTYELIAAHSALEPEQEIRARALRLAIDTHPHLNWVDLGPSGIAKELIEVAFVYAAWIAEGATPNGGTPR